MDRMVYLAMTGAKHSLEAQHHNNHNLANVDTPGFRADLDALMSAPVNGPGHDSRVYSEELTVGSDFAMNATGTAAITSSDWGISATGVVTKLASVGFDSSTVIYHDTVACNNACIKGLRAAPKQLVAAPGANKFIELVSAVLILDYGSEVLTETVDDMVIEYNTSGADITAAIEATGFIDAAADTIKIVQPSAAITVTAANSVNKAVQLFNAGDGEYGGNASNDTVMTIKVAYRVHADGL